MAKIHWKSGTGGDFNDPSAWIGGVVPGPGDAALIDASGSYTVTEAAFNTVHSLSLAANAQLHIGLSGNLTAQHLTNAGIITVDDAGALTLEGVVVNSGTIAVAGVFPAPGGVLLIGGTGAALTGGGRVELRDNTNGDHSVIPFNVAATVTLINVDNTIVGSGDIGGNGFGTLNLDNRATGVIDAADLITGAGTPLHITVASLKNAGLIEASPTSSGLLITAPTVVNSGSMVFDSGTGKVDAILMVNSGSIVAHNTKDDSILEGFGPGKPSHITNTGMIAVTGGGFLAVSGTITNNTGKGTGNIGELEVNDANSVFRLGFGPAFTTIIGGVLKTSNGGTFTVAMTTLDGIPAPLTLAGTLADGFPGSGTLRLEGTIHNEGTISLLNSQLQIASSSVTLDGGGTVTLLTSLTAFGGAPILTNVDNRIAGSGAFGAGLKALNNGASGVIDANQSQVLAIKGTGLMLTNAGTLEATASGGLTINTATLVNTGEIDAIGGNVMVASAVTGAGAAKVGDGSMLTFAAAATPNVSFIDATVGVLQLNQAATFTGTLTGFAAATLLDLRDLTLGAGSQALFFGTAAGGTLLVTNGAATDSYQLVGDYTQVGFAVSADGFGGTRVSEVGSAFGTSNNDTLSATPDVSTLVGLGGKDSYQVAVTGTGATVIQNGVASSPKPAGELLFGTGVADDQIWLDRVDKNGIVQANGNNLRLDVMGTNQSVTVANWFNPATPAASLSDIKLTDSGLKLDSAVSNLLAAMATFETSHPGFDPSAPANSTITDATVLLAVNNDWHP